MVFWILSLGWLVFVLIVRPENKILFGIPLVGFLLVSFLLATQHVGLALNAITLVYSMIFASLVFKILTNEKN